MDLITAYKEEINKLRKERDDWYDGARRNREEYLKKLLDENESLDDPKTRKKIEEALDEVLSNIESGRDSLSQRINLLACKISEMEMKNND